MTATQTRPNHVMHTPLMRKSDGRKYVVLYPNGPLPGESFILAPKDAMGEREVWRPADEDFILDLRPGDVVRQHGSPDRLRVLQSDGMDFGHQAMVWNLDAIGYRYISPDPTTAVWVEHTPTPDINDRARVVYLSSPDERVGAEGVITAIDDNQLATMRADNGRTHSFHLGRYELIRSTSAPEPEPEVPVSLSELGSHERDMADLRMLNSTQMDRINGLMEEKTELQRRYDANERLWQAKWLGMAHRLAQEATQRSWCSEYDDIASEMGLPTRDDLSEDVEYTIKADVEVTLTTSMIMRAIEFDEDGDSDGISIEVEGDYPSVTLTLTRTETRETIGCACNDVDAYEETRRMIRDAGFNPNTTSWSNDSITCESSSCSNS